MQGGKWEPSLKEDEAEVGRDAESEPKSTPTKTIKDGLKIGKARKAKTPKKEKGGPYRFLGQGVSFKAKLIGVEEIEEARGDKLCQETLTRLKQVVKTSGNHKQRIMFSISLSGVKLKEEKTGLVMYHHPVHRISFISQDVADDRAFGYICSPTPTTFHFVAIKTEKTASQVVITLRDLFQTVLDMKKQQKFQLEGSKSESFESETGSMASDQGSTSTDSKLHYSASEEAASELPLETSEPLYEDISQFESEDKGTNAERCAQVNDLLTGDLLDLNFEANVEQLQQSIAQMNFSLSAVITTNQQHMLSVQPSEVDSPVPSPEPVSEPEIELPKPFIDRYAVFEEIDTVPSIFENPAIINLPLLPTSLSSAPITHTAFALPSATIQPSTQDPFSPLPPQPNLETKIPFPVVLQQKAEDLRSFSPDLQMPMEPPPLPPRAENLSIFAELDPLGKGRPFVDKKNFFHEIKNPPKKVLKDLMGNSFDSNSPPPNPSSVSLSFDASEPSNIAFPTSFSSNIASTQVVFDQSFPSDNPPFVANFDTIPPPALPDGESSPSNPFLQGQFGFSTGSQSPTAPRIPPRVPIVSQFEPNIPERPFNPFVKETLPPSTPPPILMTSRASDPTFAVMPSPPPDSYQRKCVTPTPPLPKRNLAEPSPPLTHRPPLRHQATLASPPIPIPIRKPPAVARSASVSTGGYNSGSDSPLAGRRITRLSNGSEGRESPAANWDVFEDPLESETPKSSLKDSTEFPDAFGDTKPDIFSDTQVKNKCDPFQAFTDTLSTGKDPFASDKDLRNSPKLLGEGNSAFSPDAFTSSPAVISTLSLENVENGFTDLASPIKPIEEIRSEPETQQRDTNLDLQHNIPLGLFPISTLQVALPPTPSSEYNAFTNSAFVNKSETTSPEEIQPIESLDLPKSDSAPVESGKPWAPFSESPVKLVAPLELKVETATTKSWVAFEVTPTKPIPPDIEQFKTEFCSEEQNFENLKPPLDTFDAAKDFDTKFLPASPSTASKNKFIQNGYEGSRSFGKVARQTTVGSSFIAFEGSKSLGKLSRQTTVESGNFSTSRKSKKEHDTFSQSSSFQDTTSTETTSEQSDTFLTVNGKKNHQTTSYNGKNDAFGLADSFPNTSFSESHIWNGKTTTGMSAEGNQAEKTIPTVNSVDSSNPANALSNNDPINSPPSQLSLFSEPVFPDPNAKPSVLSPVKSPMSPEENSIFRKKQDPFADEFFQSLANK